MSTEKEEGLTALASGFRKRTLVTAKLASKMGLSYAKKMTGLGGALDKESAMKAAETLVRDMDSLKGLVLKMGQMASYLPGALPPEAQRVLARLQSQTTALDFAAVAQVFQEQFGKPVAELFDEFSPTPFAAASIGQVHRAVFEGAPVAVKVQYPGIAEALESDLKNVGRLSFMATLGSALDGPELIGELRERMREECDYRAEARNQTFFAGLLSRYPMPVFPKLFPREAPAKSSPLNLQPPRGFKRLRMRPRRRPRIGPPPRYLRSVLPAFLGTPCTTPTRTPAIICLETMAAWSFSISVVCAGFRRN